MRRRRRGGVQFAVVTGASTDIGFHLAGEFAEHSFDVVMIADKSGIGM